MKNVVLSIFGDIFLPAFSLVVDLLTRNRIPRNYTLIFESLIVSTKGILEKVIFLNPAI